jgi:endonuclease YncB( thermonuclease family)
LFGSQLVRLFSIDAPEKSQTSDDGRWHPGPLAKKALEDFIPWPVELQASRLRCSEQLPGG